MKIGFLILAALFLAGCSHNQLSSNLNLPMPTPSTTPTSTSLALKTPAELLKIQPGQKIFATLKTTLGEIRIELFADKVPVTVANFVGLAEGTQPWRDPKTGQLEEGRSLYQNTIFHRVIPDFMIQGGDPLGQGIGGPGYRFADEIVPDLQFDKAGYLAMANSGPATNGSQFFITVVPTTWLTGKHTIFGMVVSGQDVIDKIVTTPTGANDKPVTPIVLQEVVIERQ